MSRTLWKKKLIGGTSNNAASILYTPTGRAQTNAKAEFDRLNASLTELGGIRYNEETDYIQCKVDGVWTNYRKAGFLFDGILYNVGTFSEDYPMEVDQTSESGASASATIEAADVKFEVYSTAGRHNSNAYMITTSPIDITGYTNLKITRNIARENGGYDYEYIGLMPTKAYDESAPKLEALSTQGTATKTFNITSYSGEYYIIAGLRITGSGSAAAGTVYTETVTKLWLE